MIIYRMLSSQTGTSYRHSDKLFAITCSTNRTRNKTSYLQKQMERYARNLDSSQAASNQFHQLNFRCQYIPHLSKPTSDLAGELHRSRPNAESQRRFRSHLSGDLHRVLKTTSAFLVFLVLGLRLHDSDLQFEKRILLHDKSFCRAEIATYGLSMESGSP